ncbi:LCP family protein [Mycobacterium sp.]|jgi:LCP family protein required for cell wall assembly|uniref:LCP family protein n=1 Tax=Mycobacterium sp. TaxID=1785 RepID=UPI002D6CDFC8|nr:LCP family protein [Mycobacterium sp.]HZA10096.1 LCP family protein [Mycobacterium sp.]
MDPQPHGPRHRAVTTEPRRRRGFAVLRVAIGVVSALVLAGAGVGWWVVHGLVGGITVSQALGENDPKSTGGAMNILLIGLDSRKDQQGNELPSAMLAKLHAGDSDSGGYNTNTLILVHIAADDKVTAFSIPRDDYIAVSGIPGYSHIKIKEAYGLTKANTEQRLMDKGVSDQQSLETSGREAGRAATINAVRKLTGAPIDYFAEVNLAGFFDLAQSLGGVQVCLNHAVYDEYSGADFPAGSQTLNAQQALAFVRQRHGLENGDLDRTHRQQAFLVGVMRQLQQTGSFTDVTKLEALMAIARKNIVLSTGWSQQQFQRVGALAGGDVQFRTLPVVRYEMTADGEAVNIIDPAAIKAEVAAAFNNGSPTTTSTTQAPSSTVDVINAAGTAGLAATVSRSLTGRGFIAGQIRSASAGEHTSTTIEYGDGAQADAENVAALLGISASPQAADLPAGHLRVTLGRDYQLPDGLWQDEYSAVSTSETGATPTKAPDTGRAVAGGGIPCVN